MNRCNTLVLVFALAVAACSGGSDETFGRSVEASTQSTTLNGVTVTLTTSGPLVQGVNDTYTWTATNVGTATITGVGLGSNWANSDGTAPIVKQLAPGCGTQSANDIPPNAALGIWCGPLTGVSLAPGGSVSGWVTLQDTAVGPVKYNLYSLHTDPISGSPEFTVVADTESAAPGPIDVQITGSSNNGQPAVGSRFTYTFQVKNNGPWATGGGVTLSDPLPASVGFAGVTTTQGTCSGGQSVSCALGNLANGAQATIAITVTAPATAQSITNSASVSLAAPQIDTNTSNDSVGVTVTAR